MWWFLPSIDMYQPWVYVCSPSWTLLPPPHLIPQGHPSAPALSILSHASNLDWRSISHMVIHMFQCYSLKSSHPCLLPQSPKVCSLPLCLFCCLTYRVIITIFLNSIYVSLYTVLVLITVFTENNIALNSSKGISQDENTFPKYLLVS